LEAANNALKAGDLVAAGERFDEALAAAPTNVDAATGAAYLAMLEGSYAEADRILASVEQEAGEQAGDIALRRALVALEAGNLDDARNFGEASQKAFGRLIAAEVYLLDGEIEQATPLLVAVKAGASPQISKLAEDYLSLLRDPDPRVFGLAESEALWALGDGELAIRPALANMKSLPETHPNKGELVLVWAGRAIAKGDVESARAFLSIGVASPEGQEWRRAATETLIACQEGNVAVCEGGLGALSDSAPADGLADARATGAYLLAMHDQDAATRLAAALPTDAAARALHAAGNNDKALESVQDAALRSYIEAGRR